MLNVYISHPYSNDPEGNVKKAEEIVDRIASKSIEDLIALDVFNSEYGLPECHTYETSDIVCPICPLLTFPKSMSEPSGVIRRHAMAFCLSLINACDELWVCANALTPGMRDEVTRASELGKPVRWYF